MIQWQNGLRIEGFPLYLDNYEPRELCFVSHAHSDHLGIHQCCICTDETSQLAEHRLAVKDVMRLDFTETKALDPDTHVKLLPAGHCLGSAMIHVSRPEGSVLYTGDFKLRDSYTAPTAQTCEADVLLMESTFGLPVFKFPPWRQIAAQLVELVESAFAAGRQPIVMGYSLGKAQEVVRILHEAGIRSTVHGAIASINDIYESRGVTLGLWERYRSIDFHGRRAKDLRERGVLVAPPNCARAPFVTNFENPLRIMMSGWGMLKNAQYRYGVDHVLPLSDHADFDALLELIDRVHPKRIFTHHGFPEFVDHLKMRGLDARLARPDPQLLLFE